jgi:hypothetical protein
MFQTFSGIFSIILLNLTWYNTTKSLTCSAILIFFQIIPGGLLEKPDLALPQNLAEFFRKDVEIDGSTWPKYVSDYYRNFFPELFPEFSPEPH